MNTSLTSLIVASIIVSFTAGCDMQSRRANLPSNHPCFGKEGQEELECLEHTEALKGLDKIDDRPNKPAPATTSTTEIKPDPTKPGDTPELPVWNPLPPPKVDPNPPGVQRTSSTTF